MIGGAKGIGIGIDFGIPNQYCRATSKPYIEKDVLDSLRVVASAYGKSNDDADRSIVKNLVDASNPFIISNAAFKLNSGFGKYEISLTDSITPARGAKVTDNSIEVVDDTFISSWIYYSKMESAEINSYSIEISGMPEGKLVQYWYNNKEGVASRFDIKEDGIYTLPQSYVPADTGSNKTIGLRVQGSQSQNFVGFKVRIIPSFEGAFVTDGIDDLITSTKTVQEMLGGSNEITVVSMIRQLSTPNINNYTNTIRCQSTSTGIYNKIAVSAIDKTGIYGYSFDGSLRTSIINNILGDKQDYSVSPSMQVENMSAKFLVQGWIHPEGSAIELSSVAWYWTVIANKVLTTDQINQVIAYFNLDRTLKPDILCNIGKQGITNDNHADFNDKLVDYSGNGRDIQMYNLAWKGSSGVAAKKFETIKDYLIVPDEGLQELTIYNEFSYKVKSIKYADRYWTVQSLNKTDVSYPITIIADKDIIWKNILNYTDENGVKGSIRKETNVPANVPTQIQVLGFNDFDVPDNYTKVNCVSYATRTDITEFTVTFIPSYKGGILLDGINDFGKVTGMPVYKDYTFIIDRQIISIGDTAGIVASKSEDSTDVNKQGAFLFEYLRAPNNISAWSFYKDNGKVANTDFTRGISYQSKYSYNGVELLAGTALDSDKLWLGILRDRDSRFANVAIYSLMSFPYSMSEFLIERQLKKHKLGTLYPDMVEFRPVIKANNDYEIVYTAIIKPDNWQQISVGDYVTVGESVAIQIKLNIPLEVTNVSSNSLADVSFYKEETGDNVYTIYGRLLDGKSPQKINMIISSYLTMLSNSTLISNETLIKNE